MGPGGRKPRREWGPRWLRLVSPLQGLTRRARGEPAGNHGARPGPARTAASPALGLGRPAGKRDARPIRSVGRGPGPWPGLNLQSPQGHAVLGHSASSAGGPPPSSAGTGRGTEPRTGGAADGGAALRTHAEPAEACPAVRLPTPAGQPWPPRRHVRSTPAAVRTQVT